MPVSDVDANDRQSRPASRADLMECPTHGICPTCREGWGHYLADKGYVPTVESDRVRRCYQDPAPS